MIWIMSILYEYEVTKRVKTEALIFVLWWAESAVSFMFSDIHEQSHSWSCTIYKRIMVPKLGVLFFFSWNPITSNETYNRA